MKKENYDRAFEIMRDVGDAERIIKSLEEKAIPQVSLEIEGGYQRLTVIEYNDDTKAIFEVFKIGLLDHYKNKISLLETELETL